MVAHARRKLLGGERQALFHCWTRCVRRAFLCGLDRVTGIDYSHRRQWVIHREELLARSKPERLLSALPGLRHRHMQRPLPSHASCSSHFPLPTGRQDERDGRESLGSLTGGKSKAETEIRVSGSVSGSVPRVTREGRWAQASAYKDAVIAELRRQGGCEIVQLAGPATRSGMAPVPYPIRLLSTQPTRHNTGRERDPRGSRADVP